MLFNVARAAALRTATSARLVGIVAEAHAEQLYDTLTAGLAACSSAAP